jgi:hypothetical protein
MPDYTVNADYPHFPGQTKEQYWAVKHAKPKPNYIVHGESWQGGRRMRYKTTRRRGKTNRRRVKTHRRRHRRH